MPFNLICRIRGHWWIESPIFPGVLFCKRCLDAFVGPPPYTRQIPQIP